MSAYYNENNPYCVQWLKNLMSAGHIAAGDIDERDIRDVKPNELVGYTQCHFFAGIGAWSHALRLAGWPDERAVWTGSCPCQPFSTAGKGAGFADERHLWPYWFHLIQECRPTVLFGEQVEAAIRHGWLDLVQSDLEGIDYAFAAAGIPAASAGAPHVRQRLWFVADRAGTRLERGSGQELQGTLARPARRCETRELDNAASDRQQWQRAGGETEEGGQSRPELTRQLPNGFEGHSAAGGLANSQCERPQGRLSRWAHSQRPMEYGQVGCGSAARVLADTQSAGRGVCLATDNGATHAPLGAPTDPILGATLQPQRPAEHLAHAHDHFWRDADWLLCRDGRWRPVAPSTFPLVDGAPARVGRLRAYGNAIVPQVAQGLITAYMDIA